MTSKRSSTICDDRTAKLSSWRWLILVPVGALYVFSLPRTVQTLDSGELATSALTLSVPHPPGYPLHVWLHYVFVRLVPWGSVYHRAALATALLMLVAIAVLIKLARSWTGVAVAVAFATSPVVFLYAVTPDVFALHCALAAVLIALAFESPSPRRVWGAAAAFGLAAANHQSTIFLAPVLGLIVFEERRPLDRYGALALGAALCVLAYLSLLLMDVGHVDSWGHLQTTADVVRHFLRRDYGTFVLSSAGERGFSTFAKASLSFGRAAGWFGVLCLVLVGFGVPTIARSVGSRAWTAVALSLILYVAVMFPSLSVGDTNEAAAIIERFFVFPSLLLAVLAVAGQPRLQRTATAAAGVLSIVQVAAADTPALRNDVVIEEYARNLLTSAKHPTKKSLVIAYSDTQTYALRYVRATEPGFENVYVVARGLMFHEEALTKLNMELPDLYNVYAERGPGHRDLFDDFVLPNAQRYAVTHVLPYTSESYRTVFRPLGRRVEAGRGNAVDRDAQRFTPTPPVYRRDAVSYVESKALYAEYAIYELALAKELASSGDRDGARVSAQHGRDVVPYCIPCQKNVCLLTDEPSAKAACNAEARELEAQFDYLR